MEFKKSKTYQNLLHAFKGECEAFTKYTLYSKKAKKEGLNIVADIFDETAHNEIEHAKLFFKKMNDGDIPLTKENLLDCIKNEQYEDKVLYRDFANVAKEEGYLDIYNLFNMIADIEQHHGKRYQDILEKIEDSKLFSSDKEIVWICKNCGHIHKSKTPPEKCPVCAHPRGYFYKQDK